MVFVVIVVVIIPRRGKLPTLQHSTVYKTALIVLQKNEPCVNGSGPMGGGGGGRWMSTGRWARRGLSEQPMDLLLEITAQESK